MKSGYLAAQLAAAENSRRRFLQKSAQTATVLWSGPMLAGCGGGGSDGDASLNGGNLVPPANNSAGESSSPSPENTAASENSTPPPANTSAGENSSSPATASSTHENSSPSETSPTVQSFAPSAGVPGNVIVITGSKFDSTASISFGDAAATQFSVDSATQISVTVPALAIAGPVTVKTAGGTVRSSAQFAVLTAPAPATGYRLAWHDEFDGNSVDSQKWRMVGSKRDNAQQTPDAIAVSNSIVTISTYTDSGTHHTGWLDTNKNPGCKFTFGYIEARIRFVNAPGQWSAFWLMSNNNRAYTPPNPALGVEIDIIEHRAVGANNAGSLSNRYSSAVHWNGYGAEIKSIGGGVRALPAGESFSDWHTMGLLWTPTKYEFYLDGTQFWQTTEGISQSDEFILLTSEIKDKAWAGDIPPDGYGPRGASTNPVMQVDWVRIWQQPPSA